jgi:hypothetical protein
VTTAGALLDGRFEEWLAPGPPTSLWLFVHVPKTAGSSLAAELAALVPPYRSIHIDHADRARPAAERYDAVTEAFVAQQASEPARSASGHVQFRNVRRILDGVAGTRLITMLREPVARIVSDFLYQRSPMHPLAADVRAKVPDIAAFIELPGQRNRIARHLLPPAFAWEGDVAGALRFLRNRYAFIGVQDRYDLSFRALAALIAGAPRSPTATPKRVNDAAREERARVLDQLRDIALAARLANLNAFDIALYRAIAESWARIAAPLETHLDARRAEP